mmetsp:Transcript_12715/g.15356  ORF Transcript_12715/g.15356 Transcript_12715/m.15356 type:complete len:763 (+) Transcript_12715:264-2552(+)|eukprot:CAMPEP_0197865278 /NCGR_PEP_ID=MMETSP1438-20131217/43574_1 /TAXON_ID=1461541 /ORGANISM="Pterosperma sp., Strain CCMP1384" /LENGTH=762 /DNA_ID=CAMNT_0043483721 /DNA_START=262 /DNA_END=2550 /DNA_ORIENTATION=-
MSALPVATSSRLQEASPGSNKFQCEFCVKKGFTFDLNSLWQHANTFKRANQQEHRELAAYIATNFLQCENEQSAVVKACNKRYLSCSVMLKNSEAQDSLKAAMQRCCLIVQQKIAAASGLHHDELMQNVHADYLSVLTWSGQTKVEAFSVMLQEAHWYYKDVLRAEDLQLPDLGFKGFVPCLLEHCPEVLTHTPLQGSPVADPKVRAQVVQQILTAFEHNRHTAPLNGVAIIDSTHKYVLMVKGRRACDKWGFPKGKQHTGETGLQCAMREAHEETGLDLTEFMSPLEPVQHKHNMGGGHHAMNGPRTWTIHFAIGVPMDSTQGSIHPTTFAEIGAIAWCPIDQLVSRVKQEGKCASTKDLMMVLPLVTKIQHVIKQHEAGSMPSDQEPAQSDPEEKTDVVASTSSVVPSADKAAAKSAAESGAKSAAESAKSEDNKLADDKSAECQTKSSLPGSNKTNKSWKGGLKADWIQVYTAADTTTLANPRASNTNPNSNSNSISTTPTSSASASPGSSSPSSNKAAAAAPLEAGARAGAHPEAPPAGTTQPVVYQDGAVQGFTSGNSNSKGLLQQWTQKYGHPMPKYNLAKRSGPAHQPQFTATVTVSKDVKFTGHPQLTLKEAQKSAAAVALKSLNSGSVAVAPLKGAGPLQTPTCWGLALAMSRQHPTPPMNPLPEVAAPAPVSVTPSVTTSEKRSADQMTTTGTLDAYAYSYAYEAKRQAVDLSTQHAQHAAPQQYDMSAYGYQNMMQENMMQQAYQHPVQYY